VTLWLRAEKNQDTRLVTPPEAPPSPPRNDALLGLATGPLGPATGSPHVLAGDADLEPGLASAGAAPRLPHDSPKPPPVVRTRAATPPIPQALPSASPVQTRLPLGGATAASGGGVGSGAPSVVAEFEALALALAMILLGRLSLDRAAWRSALLALRLEQPG
jgi:hypothetical protein